MGKIFWNVKKILKEDWEIIYNIVKTNKRIKEIKIF